MLGTTDFKRVRETETAFVKSETLLCTRAITYFCPSQDCIEVMQKCNFKLRCNTRFQRAFTARICVFKVITLVWANQRNLALVYFSDPWENIKTLLQFFKLYYFKLQIRLTLPYLTNMLSPSLTLAGATKDHLPQP